VIVGDAARDVCDDVRPDTHLARPKGYGPAPVPGAALLRTRFDSIKVSDPVVISISIIARGIELLRAVSVDIVLILDTIAIIIERVATYLRRVALRFDIACCTRRTFVVGPGVTADRFRIAISDT
jgi:hypothetical protein